MNAPSTMFEAGASSWPAHCNEVMEISLLLPGWQVAALETAGRGHGLTAGQMVRRVLRDYLSRMQEQNWQGDPCPERIVGV